MHTEVIWNWRNTSWLVRQGECTYILYDVSVNNYIFRACQGISLLRHCCVDPYLDVLSSWRGVAAFQREEEDKVCLSIIKSEECF